MVIAADSLKRGENKSDQSRDQRKWRIWETIIIARMNERGGEMEEKEREVENDSQNVLDDRAYYKAGSAIDKYFYSPAVDGSIVRAYMHGNRTIESW